MINFILYEDDKITLKEYSKVINKFILNKNMQYQIIKINSYNKSTTSLIRNLEGKKIFIIDIEVPGKSGLEFAREIRNNKDWSSPIIICSSHKELKNTGFTSRLLMLFLLIKIKIS